MPLICRHTYSVKTVLLAVIPAASNNGKRLDWISMFIAFLIVHIFGGVNISLQSRGKLNQRRLVWLIGTLLVSAIHLPIRK